LRHPKKWLKYRRAPKAKHPSTLYYSPVYTDCLTLSWWRAQCPVAVMVLLVVYNVVGLWRVCQPH
jgi:hypothetical protein